MPSSAARGWKPPTTWRTTSAASTRAEVEREAVGIEAGEVEQVLDEALEPPGLAADDGGGRMRVVGGPVEHGLGVAADRGERGAQLVGDRHQELALLVAGPGEIAAHRVDRLGQLGELGILAGPDLHARVQVAGGDPTGGVDGGHDGPGEPPGEGGGHEGGGRHPDEADEAEVADPVDRAVDLTGHDQHRVSRRWWPAAGWARPSRSAGPGCGPSPARRPAGRAGRCRRW